MKNADWSHDGSIHDKGGSWTLQLADFDPELVAVTGALATDFGLA